MDRRLFLKLTGLVAAASALEALPVSAASLGTPGAAVERAQALPPAVVTTVAPRLAIHEAGMYQISGVVQLEHSTVEIGGDVPSQRISWNGAAGATAPFMAFTTLDGAGLTPRIIVTGGRIVSLNVTPLMLA
ncbi:MAG: hypothetical protein AB7P40_13495 [Chloroflexota bacterium]